MKRFKNPLNLIMTLLALLPVFSLPHQFDVSYVLPAAFLAILSFTHILLNTHDKVNTIPGTDKSVGDLVADSMEKGAVAIMNTSMIMPNNAYNRGAGITMPTQNIKLSKKNHGGVACWFTVAVAYVSMSIFIHDLSGSRDPFTIQPHFISIFCGIAAAFIGERLNYIFRNLKKPRAAFAFATGGICGLVYIFSGAMGYIIPLTYLPYAAILTSLASYILTILLFKNR